MRRLLVVAEERDWHLRRLEAAATQRDLALSVAPLRAGVISVGGTGPRIVAPGLDALPDAVLVRTVGGGTFEEVTLRLSLLHALAAEGVPVANEARAIERCVDKGMTSF